MNKELLTKIGVGAFAALLIALFGYRMLAGPSYPPVPTAVEQHDFADKLAVKSGGDWSKLTSDEQKRLNDISLGHGKKFLEVSYKKMHSGGK